MVGVSKLSIMRDIVCVTVDEGECDDDTIDDLLDVGVIEGDIDITDGDRDWLTVAVYVRSSDRELRPVTDISEVSDILGVPLDDTIGDVLVRDDSEGY